MKAKKNQPVKKTNIEFIYFNVSVRRNACDKGLVEGGRYLKRSFIKLNSNINLMTLIWGYMKNEILI